MTRSTLYVFCLAVAVILPAGSVQLSAQSTSTKLKLLQPRGGESFEPGDTVLVKWSGTGAFYGFYQNQSRTDTVLIEMSGDGGKSWQQIARKGAPSRDTTYKWIVPRVACDQCLLRIMQVTGEWGPGDTILQRSVPELADSASLRGAVFSDHDSLLVVNLSDTLLIIDMWGSAPVKVLSLPATSPELYFSVPSFGLQDSVMVTGMASRKSVQEGSVCLWSLHTGELLDSLSQLIGPLNEPLRGSINADGTELLIGGFTSAKIFDLGRKEKISDFVEYSISVEYSPDGKSFVVGSDKGLSLWDAETFEQRWRKPIKSEIAAFSADSKYILSLPFSTSPSKPEKLRLLDAAGGDTIYTLQLSDQTQSARMTRQSTRFLLIDGVHDYTDPYHQYRPLYPRGYREPTRAFAVTPRGTILADVSARGVVTLMDITVQPIDTLDQPFSITGILPIAVNQFVGSAEIGASRDTLIQAFVVNGGSGDVGINSVEIVSGHTADFTLTSGTGPYTLRSGESGPVGIRFTPTDSGLRSAVLSVETDFGTLEAEVFGFGLKRTTGVELEEEAGGFVAADHAGAAMSLQPNPATDHLTVGVRIAERGEYSLLLYDMRGRQLDESHLGDLEAGDRIIGYRVSSLPPGVYRLVLRSEQGSVSQVLTVVR